MRSTREERVVRVFISSTFTDFETERKILASDVFPRLRNKFASRGVSVIAVDLRWGLESEQINNLGLVDACLDQVIDCDPYFLGLLGSHYGTVVSPTDLSNSRLLKVHNLTGVFDQPISITELEFQVGALQNQNEYALFFSGVASSNADERALELLGQVERSGRALSEYESLEAFEWQAYEKLAELIDRRFPDEGVEADPETLAQDAIFFQHVKSYIPGSPVVEKALDLLRNGNEVYLQGAKGVGKSAALAYCADCLSQAGTEVFLYFCNTGYCFTDADLLRRIATYFETAHGCRFGLRDQDEVSTVIAKIAAGLSALDTTTPIVLCIDAIEQIASSRNLWLCLSSLCRQNKHVSCLVTGTGNLAGEESLVLRGLERSQVEKLVTRELSEAGRTLRDDLRLKLVECDAASNPIMLKGILNELAVSGKHDGLEALIDELCALRDVASLFRFITRRVSGEIALLGLDAEGVAKAEAFLGNVHFGASEDEVMSVSGMLPLSWVMLKTALEPFMVSYDGRMRFNHQLVEWAAGKGLADELLHEVTTAAVAEYQKEPQSTARIIELVSWAALAGDDASLSSIVFSPTAFPVLLCFDEDGLRRVLSHLSHDEGLLAEDVLKLALAYSDNAPLLYDLCLALSRSGCVRSCVAAVDATDHQGAPRADLLTLKARAIYQQGAYARVSAAFDEARRAMELEGRGNTAAYALLLLQQAIAEKSCGRGRLALGMAQEACALFERLGLENNDSLWCRTYKASLEFSYGQGAGPETFRELLASQKALSGERSFAYFRLMCYSWQSFLLAGLLDEADSLTRQSLEGLHETAGEGPDYAWALTNRATVLACLGLRDEARANSRESARLNAQTAAGTSHVYSVTGNMNEILLAFLDEADEQGVKQAAATAVEALRELRRDALEFHAPSHPYVLNIEANGALVELLSADAEGRGLAAQNVQTASKKLAEILEGDNCDSLFLDACAWAFGGSLDKDSLLARYAKLGTKDQVTERILKGDAPSELRLTLNNGAALYVVPPSFLV